MPQLSATNHGKNFLSRCDTARSSELFSLHFKTKRCAGNVIDCNIVAWRTSHHRQMLQWRVVDVWTTFFDHWVKHYLWWLLLQPLWFISYIQCVIITPGSLELIYIRWLWAAQRKTCLFALKNVLFYIFRIRAGGWLKSDNFVIAALCFIKFNYWYAKWCTQYFSWYFLNRI